MEDGEKDTLLLVIDQIFRTCQIFMIFCIAVTMVRLVSTLKRHFAKEEIFADRNRRRNEDLFSEILREQISERFDLEGLRGGRRRAAPAAPLPPVPGRNTTTATANTNTTRSGIKTFQTSNL